GIALPGLRADSKPRAPQYFAQRDKAKLVTGVSPQEFQVHGKDYANGMMEVRGAVLGVARRPDGGTLVVGANEGEYILEFGTDLPEALTDIGQNVRLLCRVVPVANSPQAELKAISAVSEFEASNFEAERAREAEAKRAEAERQAAVRRAQARTQLASRGTTTPVNRGAAGDIVAQDRNATLHFNHRLTPPEARPLTLRRH